MSTARGSDFQERKIQRMAELACGVAERLNLLSVKGAFRFGVAKALKEKGFASWGEVAERDVATRKAFFAKLVELTIPHLLKMGLSATEVETIRKLVIEENEKLAR